jgi:competence protein ComGF
MDKSFALTEDISICCQHIWGGIFLKNFPEKRLFCLFALLDMERMLGISVESCAATSLFVANRKFQPRCALYPRPEDRGLTARGVNRISQAQFVCTAYGHSANADGNAALNILAAERKIRVPREALVSGNLSKSLLQFVFSGSHMKRWNDKLRFMELIEIDKQAHKMIVAWMLCQLSGEGRTREERYSLEEAVVEGGIFDYLFRLVITDIKPPILYRIKENPEQYRRLAAWGVAEVEPHLRPLGEEFWERFTRHVFEGQGTGTAAEILASAHLYASVWEFRLLRHLNEPFDDELPEIERGFQERLAAHSALPGMRELIAGLEGPPPRPDRLAGSQKERAFPARGGPAIPLWRNSPISVGSYAFKNAGRRPRAFLKPRSWGICSSWPVTPIF